MSETRKRKWDEPQDSSPSKHPRTDNPEDAAAEIAARIAQQYGSKPVNKDPSGKDPGDLDFVKDIEINDMRNRYSLTKGPTQQQIFQETGASVTTKGTWYPDKSQATDAIPPLYLHVTAATQEALDKGVEKIMELLNQEVSLSDNKRDVREPRERRKWPEEKLPIGLESLKNFNVRAKVVGPGGMFVKYIQSETGARVQIKGLGSGFLDAETGQEANEPMHVSIVAPEQHMCDSAKTLAEDLLIVVRDEWSKAKAALDSYNTPVNPPLYMGYGTGGAFLQAYPGYEGLQPPPPPEGLALPSGIQPPPPPPGLNVSVAPPPPPGLEGAAAPAAPTQDWSAYYQQYYGAAPTGAPAMTEEQQQQYWQQLMSDPAYADYYKQYYEAYYGQQQGLAVPGSENPVPPADPSGQPQPPPTNTHAVPPPPGL